MAFSNKKLQKLIEDEQNNKDSLIDEFEDDFADDFSDDFDTEAVEPEEVAEDVIAEPEGAAEQPEESPEETSEEVSEEVSEEAQSVEEQPEETEDEAEPEADDEPVSEEQAEAEPVAEIVEDEEQPEEYDSHKMWQSMAALAVNAKECITAGAFFRANDVITAMRSMLVEMICRANGIEENFNENADSLNEECKQDIYTSYTSVLNAKELSDTVTHIMAVTYKYI